MSLSDKNINQFELFEEDIKLSNINQCNKWKTTWEKQDQEIFESKWRKTSGYIPHAITKRTITTVYGAITFKRRRYKYFNSHKNKWQYVCLLDQKIGLNNYERVNIHLKLKIIEKIASGKRYIDILDLFAPANLSKMTISNILKKFDFATLNEIDFVNYKPVVIKNGCLYIQVDETYIKLKIKNQIIKYRLRLVTYHTGYTKDSWGKKRN